MSVDAPTWTELEEEAREIVAEAQRAGLTMRVVGSAGIRLHCAGPAALLDELGRPAKDIDFLVAQQHRKGMRKLLESKGYQVDRDLLVAMEGRRYTFSHPERGVDIDVFVQRMDFCHTIDLGDRFDQHPITIPIEELLLGKLQVHKMTTTDAMDAGVILATHHQRSAPAPSINDPLDADHVARLLAHDWGFHHTATANLDLVRRAIGSTVDLGAEWNDLALAAVENLCAAIDAAPKTLAWRLRDRIGERKQWWQDVDEKEATY